MSDQALTPYSLTFINESRNPWTFCIYLAPPQVNVPDALAMAWLTAPASPTTNVTVQWKLEYGFMWLRRGTLPGGRVVISASQSWMGDLQHKNQITYTQKYSLPTFSNLTEGPAEGSLYIHQDRRVDPDKSMVGYSIAGLPAYCTPAQPNVDLIFTPVPRYWVTFGMFEQGQALDLGEITNPAQVIFPPNQYQMIARLSADNLWSIETPEGP